MVKNCNALLFKVGLIIFFVMYNLPLGIIEAIYLGKYHDLGDGCGNVWKWILAACVVNITGSVVFCYNVMDVLIERIVCLTLCNVCANLVIDVWAMITYFKNNNDNGRCYEVAPELMIFVAIHCWSFVAIMSLCVVWGCVLCVGRYFVKSRVTMLDESILGNENVSV